MGNRRITLLLSQMVLALMLFVVAAFCCAQTQSNTSTTRTNNPDGTTTVTTTTTYKDGSTTTQTTYDKDGHDAGTTHTDVQTKDGQTTTTTTKWDGTGHEIGKTIEEVKADGSKTTITYDGNGHQTGRTTAPKMQASGQNQNPSQPKKPQGLTPEDEKRIQKALNPEQTSGSAAARPEMPKADLESLRQALIKHAEKLNYEQSQALLQTNQQPKQGTASAPPPTTATIVGVVTPAHREKNKPFSGSITLDPNPFQAIPGLHVQEVKLPLVVGSDGKPTLQGLTVDLPGSELYPQLESESTLRCYGTIDSFYLQSASPAGSTNYLTGAAKLPSQPRDGRTTGQIPIGDKATTPQQWGQLTVQPEPPPDSAPQPSVMTFHPVGNPPVPVALDVTGDWAFPHPYDQYQSVNYQDLATVTPSSGYNALLGQLRMGAFVTDPVTVPGHVTAVHGAGQFSGDAHKLQISFNGEPINPIAATTDAFFFQVPPAAQEGPAQLVFADQGPNGWFAASTTVGVLHLQTGIANPNLHRGLRTTGAVGLSAGNYTGFKAPATSQQLQNKVFYDPDLINLSELQKQAPDFHPPEPGKPGFIFLSIQNRTPRIISIDGFKDNVRSWYLPADSLPFNTQLGIKAINDGRFDIGIIAQPFFPLVQMQQYRLPPELIGDLEKSGLSR